MKTPIVNPDKILYPKLKITKKELINYYSNISKRMLPHLKNRYLSVQRFPNGIDKPGFFQKNTPNYYPEWIKTKRDKDTEYSICDDEECLLYMANQATLVFHSWLSSKNEPQKPDKIIFDLDPIEVDFDYVRKGALAIKKLLEPELRTFIMTTGSKGFHIVSPIKPEMDFEEVKEITRKVAGIIVRLNPDRFTLEMRKIKRKGKVFIDFHRNTESQTAVVPYSLRTNEDATIAMPFDWTDIKKTTPQKFNIKNYKKYLKKDPWKNYSKSSKSIKALKKKIEKLI